MSDGKGMGVTQKIIWAMTIGSIFGWLLFRLGTFAEGTAFAQFMNQFVINGVLFIGGKVFINALKLLVVPLVFISLVCGVCSSSSGSQLGRVGLKTFCLYLGTTAVAVTIALTLANVTQPGEGAELGSAESYTVGSPPTLVEVLTGMVPSNAIQAMAKANMLQVIVFALLFGLAIKHSGAAGERVRDIFSDLNHVVMSMVNLVMSFAPYGVFCLVATVFAQKGIGFIVPLLLYVVTVVIALAIHGGGTYSLILVWLAKVNPLRFYKKMYPAMIFAFSTASSAATMPITLRLVQRAVGVKNSIAAFTVPMGATINMDGTAIMQGVATVFIAGAYGIDLTLADYLAVIATATLASVGTAAVPGAGMITLSMVLIQVGLPAEAIGLILGVDRILDMMRTAVNVTGDAAITTAVAGSEGQFDKSILLSDAHGDEEEDELVEVEEALEAMEEKPQAT